MLLMQILENLSARRIRVSFTVNGKTHLSAILGAYLRNGFMYFAHQVEVDSGSTLADVIDALPIPGDHPMYSYFKGGFPKGFFFDISGNKGISFTKRDYCLYPEQEYSFNLVLIGRMANYEMHFMRALEMLMVRGIGNPLVGLSVREIRSRNVSYAGFGEFAQDRKLGVRIELQTPLCLVKNIGARSRNSFQDKMNGLPSFYQFVRSVMFRLYSLNVLYGNTDMTTLPNRKIDDALEAYLAPACEAIIRNVSFIQTTLYSTPKKEVGKVMEFTGYMGKMDVEEVWSAYYPLLKYAENFNVGNDIVYGLGAFKITLL